PRAARRRNQGRAAVRSNVMVPFDGLKAGSRPASQARAARARARRGPHRDLKADSPRWFTADGQRKWKLPPANARVQKNTAHNGTWIERWEAPRKKGDKGPVRWVYNYTLAEVRRRAGIKFVQNRELARHIPDVRAQVAKDLGGSGKPQQLA